MTQVANLGEGRQIIRVKNCSGPKTLNWVGAWHPDDTRWSNVSDAIRKELDAETFHDGGKGPSINYVGRRGGRRGKPNGYATT